MRAHAPAEVLVIPASPLRTTAEVEATETLEVTDGMAVDAAATVPFEAFETMEAIDAVVTVDTEATEATDAAGAWICPSPIWLTATPVTVVLAGIVVVVETLEDATLDTLLVAVTVLVPLLVTTLAVVVEMEVVLPVAAGAWICPSAIWLTTWADAKAATNGRMKN